MRRLGLRCSFFILLLARALAAQLPPPTIILTYDAGSEVQVRAIAAIRAHVSGLPAEVVVVPVEPLSLESRLAAAGSLAASRRALGTFYVEMEPDGTVLVFFTEAEGEATLIRRLAPSPQGTRVVLEQAGIVVRSLVEALLDGGSVGIGSDTDPEKSNAAGGATSAAAPSSERSAVAAQPPSSEPSEPSESSEPEPDDSSESGSAPPRIAISAGSTATDFAAGMPWQSGFSGGLQWLATPAFYVGARYTFFPTYTVAAEDAEVSVARHPVEALVGYHASSLVAPNAELGLLLDGTRRTTVSTAPSLQATPPSARWMVSVAARAGISWSPSPRVRASAHGGADLVLTRHAYTIDSAVAIPSPHRVRPRLELELAVAVW